ncbi:MAG TPA: hypothetical protein VGI23_06055 [Steroidobacteraceae bacterium]
MIAAAGADATQPWAARRGSNGAWNVREGRAARRGSNGAWNGSSGQPASTATACAMEQRHATAGDRCALDQSRRYGQPT